MSHDIPDRHLGTLYLIVGASGSGKDTIINHSAKILGRMFVPLKCTTRKPRAGERQGFDYNFVTGPRFKKMKLFTKYGVYGAEYGVGTKLLERLRQGFDVFLNISNRLTEDIKKRYPKTLVVYVYVSQENLRERIMVRNREDEKEIAQRLERARENLQFISNADFILNNNGSIIDSVTAFASYIMHNRINEELII